MGNKNSTKKIIYFIHFSFLFCILCLGYVSAIVITRTNTITVTAVVPTIIQSPNGGGNSGGGGGGISGPVTPIGNSVVFKGIAYPGSTINLTKDGVVVATVPSAPDATFEILLNGINTGTYNFGIQAIDTDGRKSLLLTYSTYISANVTTTINGLFLPTTLSIDKSEVKRGDSLTVVGRSAPQANVNVVFNSETNLIKKTVANALGVFVYKLNTIELEYGDHEVKAQAITSTDSTSFSQSLGFKVGNNNVSMSEKSTTCPKYDVNCDKKVNLVDFSIMAYWFRRSNPPKNVDLNNDGKVDLADFSILAYRWTG